MSILESDLAEVTFWWRNGNGFSGSKKLVGLSSGQ